jgi:hypothetical protein
MEGFMKFCAHTLFVFISVFSISGIQASEPQQKSTLGWGKYFLSFFRKSASATQASKPSTSTVNVTSQEDFFKKAKPVTGYAKSELYTLYRVYDEKALAQFSNDFIALCNEYINVMIPIKLSGETVDKQTILKLEKLVLQFEYLARKHMPSVLEHRPDGNYCRCPTSEDSVLQTMFGKMGEIIRSTIGTLDLNRQWRGLSREMLKEMEGCNSGQPLVRILKELVQKAITRDGVYAVMLQRAINEVIEPYLHSAAGQCK